MKILKIGGRNLASLAEPFCVDFEAAPLASSGLFAISGPTGAGKSTLLDALCLALYGATPRLKTSRSGALVPDVGSDTVSSQDPRSLLRRGAGDGHAEVDFVGNDGLRYRARWSVRRARSRAAGALQAAVMTLHRLPDLLAIGATRTEVAAEIGQRIGLSFEQFTRAVLLAQNEFSAFLKTDENERGELLETLTGSVIYSAISRRAFERYRREQDALRALTARLADQAPLSADERSVLDADSAAADATLAVLDQRQASLDQLARWQQASLALQQGENDAEQALASARLAFDEAAPRRAHLALLDAVDAARPLLTEVERLQAEQAASQSAVLAADGDVARSVGAEHNAASAAAAAQAALTNAEQQQHAATPDLDAAKAQDAALAALAPAHAQAAAAREQAARDAAATSAAVERHGAALAEVRVRHADGAAWLAAHRVLKPLAQQWPRWDRLMQDAEQAQLQLARLDQQRAGAEQQAHATAAAAARAASAAATALQALHGAREQRAAATALLATIDGDALRARRRQLGDEREQLDGARATWLQLAQLRQRAASAALQLSQAATQAEQAQALLAAADTDSAPLAAAAAQAEASLRAAELACADSVEELRAQLTDEAPCPVCGASDHPYRDASPALHAVLEHLRQQVHHCRAARDTNLAQQASASARLAASRAQHEALAQETAALAPQLAALTQQWQAQSIAAGLPAVQAQPAQIDSADGIDAVAATLDQRLHDLAHLLAAIDQQEQAARQAQVAFDAAQRALEHAASSHATLVEQEAAARLAAGAAQASLAGLAERSAQAADTLLALLDEFDGAFEGVFAESSERASDDGFDEHGSRDGADADTAGDIDGNAHAFATRRVPPFDFGFAASGGWRAAWQAEPARFRAKRAREVAQYNEQAAAQPALQAQLLQLQEQHKGALAAASQAARLATQAAAHYADHEADIGARRRQRAELLDGASVSEVEARLRQAVDGARAALAGSHGAAEAARLASARARDALARHQADSSALAARVLLAQAALQSWLDAFGAQAPADQSSTTAPADIAALAALLAVPPSARQQEQAALAALERQVAAALTVLHERRQRQLAHREQAPANAAEALASLAEDLALLAAERKTAADTANALRLRVAQDQQRRHDAQAAMAGIERQQLVERRWGKLSDLIGSADGKKFRNYAQQFTLDVLLGYANAHLAQLAKRYRLERVGGGGGPSLGLMVRDQDMGGEVRGVNSLSGGESFLVSLALALGLASLSSNRVKVESLFIDEGFGSLDSETLRVAMDALDGLQAMGRKVGVISHVQEMTERIATRIIVQPSGGGSSSVTVA